MPTPPPASRFDCTADRRSTSAADHRVRLPISAAMKVVPNPTRTSESGGSNNKQHQARDRRLRGAPDQHHQRPVIRQHVWAGTTQDHGQKHQARHDPADEAGNKPADNDSYPDGQIHQRPPARQIGRFHAHLEACRAAHASPAGLGTSLAGLARPVLKPPSPPLGLGAYPAKLHNDTLVQRVYGQEVVYERHRHRYELQQQVPPPDEDAGMVFSAPRPTTASSSSSSCRPRCTLLIAATQAHPEFKSRPDRPHPLFAAFVTWRADGPRTARRAAHRGRAGAPGGRPQPVSDPGLPDDRRHQLHPARRARRRRRRGAFTCSVHHPGAVVAVPVEPDREHVLLVRQYRVAADRELLEVRGGQARRRGRTPETTASREMPRRSAVARAGS